MNVFYKSDPLSLCDVQLVNEPATFACNGKVDFFHLYIIKQPRELYLPPI